MIAVAFLPFYKANKNGSCIYGWEMKAQRQGNCILYKNAYAVALELIERYRPAKVQLCSK